MWIARNKFDTYENDSLVLWLDDEKPTRNDNDPYKYWFGVCGVELKPYSKKWYDKYSYLTWEDEPVEVNIFTNEFVQGFGDACYEQGEQDACRFEYGENPEGNLTIKEYVDSENKTL